MLHENTAPTEMVFCTRVAAVARRADYGARGVDHCGDIGMTTECKHGQLARSCELCEKDARIAELETALRRIRGHVELPATDQQKAIFNLANDIL